MILKRIVFFLFTKVCLYPILYLSLQADAQILQTPGFKHYVDTFNADYPEKYKKAISNKDCWEWMEKNIPFFECPDKGLERTYYFRWYTFRKHIRETSDGFVITEFLPDVPWAGKYNTINATACHHFYEGRWLRNKKYLNDYAVFWFRHDGSLRFYSDWLGDAIYHYYLITKDKELITTLLPDIITNYEKWEASNEDSSGLFWQLDVRDGGEESIGGNGYRPTINSYMYGNAMAISKMAGITGNKNIEIKYLQKAILLKEKIQQKLWDNKEHFFKVLPKEEAASLVCVKELIGYLPWYFNLPDTNYSTAWKYLTDTTCFKAPFGPTTAERNHSRFMYESRRVCMWNGYSWPFATSQTLTALINVLNNYKQDYLSKNDFFDLLQTYCHSQRIKLKDERVVPWIDESLNPFTGDWFTRTQLYERSAPDKDRGEDYNHSTFNDLIISGLVGVQPQEGNRLVINPLLPVGEWEYFCLDRIEYNGGLLTVLYDKSGEKYHRGKGLIVFKNGKKIASSPSLKKLTITL